MPLVAFLIAALLAIGDHAAAQSVHLTPVPRLAYPDTAVLLEINPAPAADNDDLLTQPGVRLRIHDGSIYISVTNTVEEVELGDRTIAEFIEYFHAKYPKVGLISGYPELKVSELREGTYTFAQGPIEIGGRQGRPQIAAALGIGFIANEVRSGTGSNTLVRNAGVDLDLVGTKPFRDVTVRTRIGFHSAEAVPVSASETDSTANETPAPEVPTETGVNPTDPRSIVEAAQAIAVGVNIDYHFGLPAEWDANQFHFSVGLEASQFWASPDQFVFPTVPVDGARKPIEDVFSADEIERARNQLERVIPLRTVVGGPRFLFGRRDNHVFYIVADVGWRQYHHRRFGIRYSVDPPTATEPQKLTPRAILAIVDTNWEPISRFGVGVRLANSVDFKLDVVAPLEDRAPNPAAAPVLRIMIATPDLRFGR